MAFGSTQQVKKESTEKVSFDPVYLNLKAGKRIVRILGDEVSYKVYWLDVAVKDSKRGKRPIIVARLVNGAWKGHADENWYKNPYQEYISTLPEEKRKTLYAKTRFVVNVYDRTPVIKTDDGLFYPDLDGKYQVSGEPNPHNTVMLLEGSSGTEGGKHFLAEIVDTAGDLRSLTTGKPLTLAECDIVITTKGEGIETKRRVNTGMNQEPLQYVDTDLYDLDAFVIPWPHMAIQKVLDGAVYEEVREEFNLPAYPKKVEPF